MKTERILIKRNITMFFKDYGMLFSSLATPLILLVLYATFLSNIYRDAYSASLGAMHLEERLINGLVGGQLFSSLLSVTCVTVAFCSNLLMVQDKVTGARKDLTIAPVKRSSLAVAYYSATFITTMMVVAVALVACLVYLGIVGWYLSFLDILALLLDVLLLVLFGTALSSVVNYFLTSQGQISTVGTIVSAGYGFVCGAYMPISSFSEGLRNVLAFFPGAHGTSLLRNHALAGAFREMSNVGVPAEVIESLRDSVDCSLYCMGERIPTYAMYLVLAASCILLFLAFVAIHRLDRRRR